MTRELFLRLIVPLLLVSVVSISLSACLGHGFDAAGFCLNIGNDALAIAATIWYVDRVLKSHEEKQWQLADRLIGGKIDRFFAAGTSTLIKAFESVGLYTLYVNRILEPRPEQQPSSSYMRRLAIDVAQELLTHENIESGVRAITETQWLGVIGDIERLLDEATSIIDVFGNRLSPEKTSLILQVQEHLNGIISAHATLEILFDVDDRRVLPDRMETLEKLRSWTYKEVAASFTSTLEKLIALGEHMEATAQAT